jgi:hypothetical protein
MSESNARTLLAQTVSAVHYLRTVKHIIQIVVWRAETLVPPSRLDFLPVCESGGHSGNGLH